MKKQILLLLLIPFLSITCKDNEGPFYDSEMGSVYVTIQKSNDLIPEAIIFTNPETYFFQTDSSGSTIVKDIQPGTFEITAYHPAYGSGSETVTVKQGEVTALEINLIAVFFKNPIVNFVSPENGSNLDIDTPIDFSVIVSDNNDNPEDINLEWSSNLDGLLSTESADINGVATITLDNLSEGDHAIQVKATDSDGYIGGAIVAVNISDIPNSVFLNPLQGQSTGIQLNWTTFDESDFSKYKIYRSTNNIDFDKIETIDNINTTTYFDTDASIGESYYYHVGVNLSNGDERLSNTQFLPFEGLSIYVGTELEKMIVDPDRPFIYALDKDNNSLLFIDTDNGILAKTIFVGSSPTDLDISLDGEKLYIANFGSTQINVVDLNTQEIDFNFFVDPDVGTWDGNPYRIVTLSNNRIAFTSEDQWNSVKVVDATSGLNLGLSGSVDEPNLFSNLEGTVIYVAESSSTGSQVLRYNLVGNTLEKVDESSSGSAWERNGFIPANGEYIFFRKQKILASNLQSSLGTFPESVYTSNKDGSIVLGEEQYFNGTTFSTIGTLPIATKIVAADPNEDIFYLYNSTSKSIVVFTP